MPRGAEAGLRLDVHQSESQICRLTEDGEIIEKRIATRADRLAKELGTLPRARILIEASTVSEWVARVLVMRWLGGVLR